jgi:hypothetical protein
LYKEFNKNGTRWTAQEVEVLLENVFKVPADELRRLIPGRDESSFATKLHGLRHPYTEKNPLYQTIKMLKGM